MTSVTFSPDGKMVVGGQGSGLPQIWDTTTGETIREPELRSTFTTRSVAFSPDRKTERH